MLIRIVKEYRAEGKGNYHLAVGKVVDLPEDEARELIDDGIADPLTVPSRGRLVAGASADEDKGERIKEDLHPIGSEQHPAEAGCIEKKIKNGGK